MAEEEQLEKDAIAASVCNALLDFCRHLDAEVLGPTTYTTPPEDSNLTLDKLLSIKRKFDEERKQFELTIGEHTFNILDYAQRETEFPEGGILLTDISRTESEKFVNPKATDMILMDVQAKQVWFLGAPLKKAI